MSHINDEVLGFFKVQETIYYLANQIQKDLRDTKDQDVLCSCARMWIRSAMMMITSGQIEEALSANSKAEELLPLIMDPNIHQLVVEQQCNIKFATFKWLQSVPISSLIKVEDLETIAESQTTPVKTPIRSQKNLLTTKQKNPLCENNPNVTPITPFARPVNRLKILSSGEENTPPCSPPKTKSKRRDLPKFVTETPQSIYKSTKSSRKPFAFYHDDEFPVNSVTSTSKLTSKIKKKRKQPNDKSDKSANKTLIPSVISITPEKFNLKTENIPVDDNIIRKSKRTTNTLALKTYKKSKIPLKKGCQTAELVEGIEDNTKEEGAAFLIDKMKTAISNATHSKNAYCTQFSSSFSLPKKTSSADLVSSFSELNIVDSNGLSKQRDSKHDCDIVEGTPPDPPKKTFVQRSRKARSNKL